MLGVKIAGPPGGEGFPPEAVLLPATPTPAYPGVRSGGLAGYDSGVETSLKKLCVLVCDGCSCGDEIGGGVLTKSPVPQSIP